MCTGISIRNHCHLWGANRTGIWTLAIAKKTTIVCTGMTSNGVSPKAQLWRIVGSCVSTIGRRCPPRTSFVTPVVFTSHDMPLTVTVIIVSR